MAASNNLGDPNRFHNQQNFGGTNNFGFWPPDQVRVPRGPRLVNSTVYQGGSTTAGQGGPPPIPPRLDQSYATNGLSSSYFNRMGTGYGLGSQSYMPYSPYSSYNSPYHSTMFGGYGYGNRLGYGTDAYGGEGAFFRMAEESSRQAFQSIESIVQAFASVSMMMESTYHAVYSSFRAVIGVADHFSRLRSHLAQVLSTLALVRTLHWLYRKALYLLGISLVNPSSEAAWSAATRATAEALNEADLKGGRSSWPILMFLGVILGAPWLIWRVLATVTSTKLAERWAKKEGEHYVARALYDFRGEPLKELTFCAGQEVILAPRALQPRGRGWVLASVDGTKTGLVPTNYIRIQNIQASAPQNPQASPSKPTNESANEQMPIKLTNDIGSEENESSV